MITREQLTQSQVRFEEDSHRYFRDDKELSGITGLIHSVLRLGVYPEADQRTQEVYIPQAGYYGKCVHRAIEAYERYGLEMTVFPVEEHATEHFGVTTFPAHDVCVELESYKALKGRFDCIGVEFLVDYGDYASCIDCIWVDEQGRIYLVDHKTNNLGSYPGGVEGLKEYLSWQLSCYAVMFEAQTGLKVAGLLANWFRHGERRQWEIVRQPDEQVECLLGTVVLRNPVGGWLYINEAMQRKDDAPVVATQADLAVPVEVTAAIADLLRAERAAKQMKERLRELMEQNGVTKWECDQFTATIGKATSPTTFDAKALKEAEPEIYDRYTKQVSKKGNFTLKLK